MMSIYTTCNSVNIFLHGKKNRFLLSRIYASVRLHISCLFSHDKKNSVLSLTLLSLLERKGVPCSTTSQNDRLTILRRCGTSRRGNGHVRRPCQSGGKFARFSGAILRMVGNGVPECEGNLPFSGLRKTAIEL